MNKIVDDKMTLRRRNLNLYRQAVGDEWQTLAKRLKVSKSYLSQLSSGYRPFSEKTAREFEKSLGIEIGFFDEGQISTPRRTSQSSDDPSLALVIAAIDSGLKASRKSAFRDDERYGRLLELLYEDSLIRGIPPADWIGKLVKLILEKEK